MQQYFAHNRYINKYLLNERINKFVALSEHWNIYNLKWGKYGHESRDQLQSSPHAVFLLVQSGRVSFRHSSLILNFSCQELHASFISSKGKLSEEAEGSFLLLCVCPWPSRKILSLLSSLASSRRWSNSNAARYNALQKWPGNSCLTTSHNFGI